MTTLISLPTEILEYIFQNLTDPDRRDLEITHPTFSRILAPSLFSHFQLTIGRDGNFHPCHSISKSRILGAARSRSRMMIGNHIRSLLIKTKGVYVFGLFNIRRRMGTSKIVLRLFGSRLDDIFKAMGRLESLTWCGEGYLAWPLNRLWYSIAKAKSLRKLKLSHSRAIVRTFGPPSLLRNLTHLELFMHSSDFEKLSSEIRSALSDRHSLLSLIIDVGWGSTLCSLKSVLPASSSPLQLTHLKLTDISLADLEQFSPHFRCLQSLDVGYYHWPELWLGESIWQCLELAHTHLQVLEANNVSAALLQYLISYNGLRVLKFRHVNRSNIADISPDLDKLWHACIFAHTTTLVELVITRNTFGATTSIHEQIWDQYVLPFQKLETFTMSPAAAAFKNEISNETVDFKYTVTLDHFSPPKHVQCTKSLRFRGMGGRLSVERPEAWVFR